MKYRKKPVTIEAVQWTGFNRNEMNEFIGVKTNPEDSIHSYGENNTILIRTLEGVHTGNALDWIIKGVKGEFYPCKPDIFALTYETPSVLDKTSPMELLTGIRKAKQIYDDRLKEANEAKKALKNSGNDYIGKISDGFYETFKKELPQFHSDNPVAYVVGECMRAARRAEMKVTKKNIT